MIFEVYSSLVFRHLIPEISHGNSCYLMMNNQKFGFRQSSLTGSQQRSIVFGFWTSQELCGLRTHMIYQISAHELVLGKPPAQREIFSLTSK